MLLKALVSEFLYRYGLYGYAFLLKIIAFRHQKAWSMIVGRKNWRHRLTAFKAQNNKPVIWFHVASLGEFEQARPVIEYFYNTYPNKFALVITFFSPSGYEVRKNYPLADFISYLPFDFPHTAKTFIEILNPGLVIFTKYDLWYYYLKTLKNKGIPTFLISAKFRPNQIFFHPFGIFFRNMLDAFEAIFVQDYSSMVLLKKYYSQVSISGDTRFDRVKQIFDARKKIDVIESFKNNSKLLVCGSTWNSDLDQIMPVLISDTWRNAHNLKVVIVPHDVHKSSIQYTEKKCQGKFVTFSSYTPSKAPFLIVDQVGMLSSIYSYADIVYIGGGFGRSIHNTLEAAVYGVPICFGPAHKKFMEALDLLHFQAACTITNSAEWRLFLEKTLENETYRKKMGAAAQQYVMTKIGATSRIVLYLETCYPEYFNA